MTRTFFRLRTTFLGQCSIRQRIACFFCMLSGMASSVSNNWYTPLVEQLSSEGSPVPMTSDTVGWLVSIQYAVEPIGAFLSAYMADRWGRKPALLMVFPLYAVSWLIIGIFQSIPGLVVARLFQGVSTGFVYTLAPIYGAEVASPELRGQLGAYLQALWNCGLLYLYAVGPLLQYEAYVAVSTVPTIVFFLAFLWMPETPYYLLMKGREADAQAVLSWLRDGSDTSKEIESIRKDISAATGRWQDLLLSAKYRRNLGVVILLYAVRFLGGVDTVAFYVLDMMHREGLQDRYQLSIILALAMVTASICSSQLSDRCGRRPLILSAVVASCLSTLLVALSLYFKLNHYILFTGLLVFLTAGNIGLVPVLDVLQAEYFPSNIRAFAGSVVSIFSNIFVFTSMKQYQVFEDSFDSYANYAFFFGICLSGLIILIPFLTETKNQSLGELHSSPTCVK